jgi:hypothetical protein
VFETGAAKIGETWRSSRITIVASRRPWRKSGLLRAPPNTIDLSISKKEITARMPNGNCHVSPRFA